MKIACIAQIRDECDIIELFVRINSRVVDHFFIIDNDSCDATKEILGRLQKEGFPITINHDSRKHYVQSENVTKKLHQASKYFDWFLFLDADEFVFEQKQNLHDKLRQITNQANSKGADPLVFFNWQTAAPVVLKNTDSPLYSCFRPLSKEGAVQSKVMVPKELSHCTIRSGSHGITVKNRRPIESLYPFNIIHVPVRSQEQIIAKTVLSSHRIHNGVGNSNQNPNHYDGLLKTLRNKSFKLGIEDLQEISVLYSGCHEATKPQFSDLKIGSEQDKIIYKDLTKINLPLLFDHELNSAVT
jgi:hypothetical protein